METYFFFDAHNLPVGAGGLSVRVTTDEGYENMVAILLITRGSRKEGLPEKSYLRLNVSREQAEQIRHRIEVALMAEEQQGPSTDP